MARVGGPEGGVPEADWPRIVHEPGMQPWLALKRVFHDLRHAFATSGLRAGVDRRILSRLLGHANEAMTGLYQHVDDPMVSAAQSMPCMPGVSTRPQAASADLRPTGLDSGRAAGLGLKVLQSLDCGPDP